MKRTLLLVAAATVAVGGYALAQTAPSPTHPHAEAVDADDAEEAEEGQLALAVEARITPEQAQAIAQRARPGRVSERELEREPGGSGLRYSFDIVADGKTFEVGVDAQSGAVLENAEEGPDAD